jgi:hypothetical protein
VELGQRDQRCRTAADPVEEGDHLRHCGHLHLARPDRSDRTADHHPEGDQPVALELVLGERHCDRECHPGRAELIPAARVARRGEEPERQDEGHDRDQVEQVSQIPAHRVSA